MFNPLILSSWTQENKNALRRKTETLGIQQGGILKTQADNLALYIYLTKGN